ncbi:hypothetical protein ACHAWU_005822 [Discostella pseudostelligera]|uniref:Uncharacterized protein n=1 Tax=Discostella pseudostelligera TaxID=259834 RepID=A0ABD3MF28_9STRA
MSSSGTHNSVGSNILSPVAYIMPTTFNPPPTRTQKQNHWSSFINNSLDFASRSAGPQLHLNSMTLYFHPIKEISSGFLYSIPHRHGFIHSTLALLPSFPFERESTTINYRTPIITITLCEPNAATKMRESEERSNTH